jgi:dTDP-4-amino-4,6-dideoxygalactose transaminase
MNENLRGPQDPDPEDLEGEEFETPPEEEEEEDDDLLKLPRPQTGSFRIPLFNLHKQYKDLCDELSMNIGGLIFMSQFVGGDYLDQFESQFASYHNKRYCIGVGSGTDALWLSLLALDVSQGDEVIVPTNTFIATAFAVSHCGARVRFVDVDPKTYNLDIDHVEEAINTRTRAIIPVHLYGQPCNMTDLMYLANKRNIPVIEDCAQAVGSTWETQRVGSFGLTGCFSFYPTKNLGGLGQGGAVVTDDKEVAEKVRSLGNMGRKMGSHTEFAYKGFNSRLDSINALFIKRMMARLQTWNHNRQAAAFLYDKYFEDFGAIKIPFVHEKATHVYHLYQIKCLNNKDREGLREYLDKNKVSTGVYYPIPCHEQQMYRFESGNYFPVAEELAETLLALPMFPHITDDEIEYISNLVIEYFSI